MLIRSGSYARNTLVASASLNSCLPRPGTVSISRLAATAILLIGPHPEAARGAIDYVSEKIVSFAMPSAGASEMSPITQNSVTTTECTQRKETGTWVKGSDSYSNYPGGEPPAGWKTEPAGNGNFWVLCDNPPQSPEEPPAQEIIATPQTVIVTVPVPIPAPAPTTAAPESRPRPKPTTTTVATTTTIIPKLIPNEDTQKLETLQIDPQDPKDVFGEREVIPVNPARDRSGSESPGDPAPTNTPPPNDPRFIVIKPNGTGEASAAIDEGQQIEVPGGSPPDGQTPIQAIRATQEVKQQPELSSVIQEALQTNNADTLVQFVNQNPAFNPITEGAPDQTNNGQKVVRLPSSKELPGAPIYNFDPDTTDKKRLGTPSAIATTLLFAQIYQDALTELNLTDLQGSCIRIGDLSALEGHETHSGSQGDITSQIDCVERTEPGNGPAFIYNSPNYNRELTRRIIEKLKVLKLNGTPLVNRFLFNDPELIAAGLTAYAPNHYNHLHFETNPITKDPDLKNYASGGVTPPDEQDSPPINSLEPSTAPAGRQFTVPDRANGETVTVVIQDPNKDIDDEGVLKEALNTTKRLLPEEVKDLAEVVTGKKLDLEPYQPEQEQQESQVVVISTDESTNPSPSLTQTPNSPQNPKQPNNLPPDPRNMTDEQLTALGASMSEKGYIATHSQEEFVEEYRDIWEYISRRTGAPVEVIAAHAFQEGGGSNDPDRQAQGLPSQLFERAINVGGIKASGSKQDGDEKYEEEYYGEINGCRLPYLETINMKTAEGTPGQVDRRMEIGEFCFYRNRRDAAESYARLMEAVYGFDGNPVDPQTAVARMKRGWATDKTWGSKILELAPKMTDILKV